MTWLSFNWLSGPLPPPDPPKSANGYLLQLNDQLGPGHAALAIFAAGSLGSFGSSFLYRRYFRRIRSCWWVTPRDISRRRWIKGVVKFVRDNDNFRLYHTPGFGWGYPLKFRRVPSTPTDLRGETIHIRIGGIDAPEGGYFGGEKQPFSNEAHKWLKSEIEGKLLYCQLRQRDQYGRIICYVQKPSRWFGTLFNGEPLALKMLRAGWATTYQQADEYLIAEEEARSAKRGMWKNGVGELPAEYKARHRALRKEAAKVPKVGELHAKYKAEHKALKKAATKMAKIPKPTKTQTPREAGGVSARKERK